MGFHVGQPNDAYLRRRMSEWLRDGFKEFAGVADFRVVCDETNNPPAMETEGKFVRADFCYTCNVPFARVAWHARMQLENGEVELSNTVYW